MSKQKDPLQQALADGRSFTWTISDGGDLASMRAAVKHGQTLTMSPIVNPGEIQVGDMVLVRWHGGTIFHLVDEKKDGEFLIVNSVGKVNGWVPADDVLGHVTHVVDPPPRPSVLDLLDQLETLYRRLIEQVLLDGPDADRLLAVVADLRWYSRRIDEANWDKMPRSNVWSFHQNLWRLARRIQEAEVKASPEVVRQSTDLGKVCVGAAAEIVEVNGRTNSELDNKGWKPAAVIDRVIMG